MHTLHTYTHTHMHMYIPACMHACMHTYIHTYIHRVIDTYIHPCMHACMHACIHMYLHTYMPMFSHTHIHMYMCTSIHRLLRRWKASMTTAWCFGQTSRPRVCCQLPRWTTWSRASATFSPLTNTTRLRSWCIATGLVILQGPLPKKMSSSKHGEPY